MTEPKYVVCPTCDGEGFFSKIGAFTSADMDDWYGDDSYEREEFVREYTTRGGAYDERCDTCKGDRVVLTADLPEIEQRLRDEAEIAAEYAAESRYFGGGGW